MPTFYDLMKFAATGIASPDTTVYDKMRALAAFSGGETQTLNGIPPLSFKSNGSPLISWSMLGNGKQNGTPTPDAPIMPEFCGVRSANVMPAVEKKTVIDNGVTFESDGIGRYHISGKSSSYSTARFNLITGFTVPVSVSNGGRGTLSFFNNTSSGNVVVEFYNGTTSVDYWSMNPKNRVHTAYTIMGNKYIDAFTITVFAGETIDMIIAPEFTNDGVLPNEFEPYGYKIPITCAGQTAPVYLGQTQTVRRIKKLVLDGTEVWNPSNKYFGSCFTFLIDTAPDSKKYSPIVCTHVDQQSGEYHYSQGRIDDNSLSLWLFGGSVSVETFKSYLAAQYAAGTPVTVWYVLAEPETGIVNEPLAKIGDYADELHSADAGVTIPTAKGQNTLTVDTELQPSSMTITFK